MCANVRSGDPLLLDIGGEGRHHDAWNLNPSPVRTVGKRRGTPIRKLIIGSADQIPFSDDGVDSIIAERTPLRIDSLREIARVIAPQGTIILRHAVSPRGNPHRLAEKVLPGRHRRRMVRLGETMVQETTFQMNQEESSE